MTDYGSGALGDWESSPSGHSIANWDLLGTPGGPRVALVGDSIGNRIRTKLAPMLDTEFDTTLAWDCWSGRDTTPAVNDLLTRDQWPDVLVMECGTNDIFNPPVMAAQIQRVIDACPATTKLLWVDTQVCRINGSPTVARQLSDQRNTGWVNNQIWAALGAGVDAVIAWSYWLSRGSLGGLLKNYLEDGVHPWIAAGSTPYAHASGVDYMAEVIMKSIRPLLAV